MKQMLIYEDVVPLTLQDHGAMSLAPVADFGFARDTNSMPILVHEFGPIAQNYAIVFSQAAEGFIPTVLLGLRDKENAFVNKKGQWSVPYIPAFARRYPFVFAADDKRENFTLMIDQKYPGLNKAGKGERLFDDNKEQGNITKNAVAFLSEYQAQLELTLRFSAKLAQMDILEPGEAHVPLPGDPERRIGGFFVVKREKLRALSAAEAGEMHVNGEMELIYCHLFSLNNLSRLQEKMSARLEAMSEDLTAMLVHVKGFVQGVGFRDFLTMAAQHHKLDGWVRNRTDGSVEALVHGPTKAVEGFVASAMKGPPGARVGHVDLHNSEPPDEKGFKRLPSV